MSRSLLRQNITERDSHREVVLLSDAEVGAWLRRYRERHGLSQKELAGLLNRTQPSVSMIEKGQRPLSGAELLSLLRNEASRV